MSLYDATNVTNPALGSAGGYPTFFQAVSFR